MTDKNHTDIDVETVETQDEETHEKMLSQSEVNKLLAKERREWKSKLESLQADYDAFKGEIDAKNAEVTAKNAAKVDILKQDLPEQVIKLLDKLTLEEQLEWLENEANLPAAKKHIPATPEGKDRDSKPVKTIPVVRF